MKIALIGYGKMGRTIEALGKAGGDLFPLIIDENSREELRSVSPDTVDVAIEFSVPEAAPGNIRACLDRHIPVVSGTTGWQDRFGEIKEYCLETGGALFYASNFSIGVTILQSLNRKLAQIMNSFPGYRVSMKEVHHIHKLDAPSGTAITLAEQIIEENDRLKGWQMGGTEVKNPGVLPIEAIREGEEKGFHAVQYESEVDIIELSHQAKSREAFAAGALLAARFLRGKAGIFGMEDLLKH